MKEIDVSDLLGIWFHDVEVSRISVDYVKREIKLTCTIPIGFWNTPNRDGLTEGEKRGTLLLTGLLFVSFEPPDENYPYEDGEGITITSEGSATTAEFKERYAAYLAKMPQNLPEEAFLHYFYVVDWNTFIFVAARNAIFQSEQDQTIC